MHHAHWSAWCTNEVLVRLLASTLFEHHADLTGLIHNFPESRHAAPMTTNGHDALMHQRPLKVYGANRLSMRISDKVLDFEALYQPSGSLYFNPIGSSWCSNEVLASSLASTSLVHHDDQWAWCIPASAAFKGLRCRNTASLNRLHSCIMIKVLWLQLPVKTWEGVLQHL